MTRMTPTHGWQGRVASALGVILLVALVSRVVWYALAPLIPVATTGLFLLGIAYLLYRWRS